MSKFALYSFAFLMTLAASIGASILLTGRVTRWISPAVDRSCQIKEVRLDGRVVWTPCSEWTR